MSLQQVAKEMVGDGEQQSDLGQLPGHHPLIKDGLSDEGLLYALVSYDLDLKYLISICSMR